MEEEQKKLFQGINEELKWFAKQYKKKLKSKLESLAKMAIRIGKLVAIYFLKRSKQ